MSRADCTQKGMISWPRALGGGINSSALKVSQETPTFSRSIADTVLKNYDGFLKVDGEVGNKKVYDPRAWGKTAETALAARVVEATQQLGSAGHSGK